MRVVKGEEGDVRVAPGARGGSPGAKKEQKKQILIKILMSECKNIDIARLGKLQQ